MPEYRRSYIPGGTYFFTVVTFNRMPLFANEKARTILHNVWNMVQIQYPFDLNAICLLPDHIHCIWTLPEHDADYPKRWKAIKSHFSRLYRSSGFIPDEACLSRQQKGETAIWQRRYWEHTIKDEQDYNNHFDYIHYNPVKHGLVRRPGDWPYSTFQKYVKMGYYDPEWGDNHIELMHDNEFGE